MNCVGIAVQVDDRRAGETADDAAVVDQNQGAVRAEVAKIDRGRARRRGAGTPN